MKKYIVRLTQEQRQDLHRLISTGAGAARKVLHARLLLKADAGEQGPGWTDEQISEALEVSPSTLVRVRRTFAEQGLHAALNRRSFSRTRPRRLDGEQEAHLIALAGSAPPDGRDHWSLRLLADRLVTLEVVEEVSHETVRHVLKKTNSSRGKSGSGASRRKPMPSLSVRWRTPWTCTNGLMIPSVRRSRMDEVTTQVLAEVCPPLPAEPGQPRRQDDEEEREGVCNVFIAYEPLAGRRVAQVRAQRTRRDWAEFMREVLDQHYSEAEKVVLVMENLNTHSPASFYEAYPPAEAHRLARKLEIHYTPKHGSWVNMAEIDLSVLSRQCLSRRLGTAAEAERQVQAWETHRNQDQAKVDWRFTTPDARIKLKRLYPSQED